MNHKQLILNQAYAILDQDEILLEPRHIARVLDKTRLRVYIDLFRRPGVELPVHIRAGIRIYFYPSDVRLWEYQNGYLHREDV